MAGELDEERRKKVSILVEHLLAVAEDLKGRNNDDTDGASCSLKSKKSKAPDNRLSDQSDDESERKSLATPTQAMFASKKNNTNQDNSIRTDQLGAVEEEVMLAAALENNQEGDAIAIQVDASPVNDIAETTTVINMYNHSFTV